MNWLHAFRRVGWVLAAAVAIPAAALLAWPEFRYVLFAKTVQAHVNDIREVVESRRRSDELVLHVEYEFADNGETRHEFDRVPLTWVRPSPGETTPVEFLPGLPLASRLAGHRNLASLTLLFVALAFFTGFVIPQIRLSPRSSSEIKS